MTLERVRQQLESLRSSEEHEGHLQKEAELPLHRMRAAYAVMPADERPSADAVIVEWLASDDENLRFDAIALIDEFRIVAAAAGLRRLRTRLPVERLSRRAVRGREDRPGAAWLDGRVGRSLNPLGGQPGTGGIA